MTRARPGAGTITPHKGRFRLRMPVDGERRSVGVYDTREEAERVRAALLVEQAADTAGRMRGLSLRVFGERFLTEREIEGVRGIRTERSRWKTHVDTAPFADDPLDMIGTPVIDAWAKAMQRKMTATPYRASKRISRKTVREVVSLLGLAFDRARVLGLVAENPVDPVKVRGEVRTHEPWTYLLPEEQTALLSCEAIPEPDRLTIAFAIGTGLREGEQFSLRLPDVHVDGAEPHVVVRYGSKHAATKSGKVATVALFGIGLTAARRWLQLLPDFTRDAKGHERNPLRLMFPGRHGGHRGVGKNLHASRTVVGADGKPKAVKVDLFREHLATAGIIAEQRHDGRPVRWHDLRHTCASSLVAGWWGPPWSLEQVRAYLRHSSITVTQRYAHLGKTAMRAAADAMPDAEVAIGWTPDGHPRRRSTRGEPAFQGVGRRGLEPRANGLKAHGYREQDQALTCASVLRVTLEAVASALANGDASEAVRLGVPLAEDALREGVAVEQAIAVMRGGPMMYAAITTLCGALADAVAPGAVAPDARTA